MGAIVLIRPLSYTLMTAAAAALASAVLGYLAVAEYAKKAPLAGTLVPATGAIRIVSPQPGLVRERRVREGERVVAGEALLRLVDPRATRDDGPVGAASVAHAARRLADLRRQRDGTRDAARAERDAIASRIAGLEAERTQLDAELAAMREREALAGRSLARLRGSRAARIRVARAAAAEGGGIARPAAAPARGREVPACHGTGDRRRCARRSSRRRRDPPPSFPPSTRRSRPPRRSRSSAARRPRRW